MSLGLIIYLASLCDSIITGAGIFLMLMVWGLVGALFLYHTSEYGTEERKYFKKWKNKMFCIVIPLAIFVTVVPSSTTVYLILGASLTENVINSEMYNDVTDIVSIKLKDIKKELTK